MILLYVVIGFLLGGIISWFLSKDLTEKKLKKLIDESEKQKNTINSDLQAANALLKDTRDQLTISQNKADELQKQYNIAIQAKVKAQTEVDQIKIQLVAEKQLLENAKEQLKDAFKSLAGDTLSKSTEDFLKLAKENFDKIVADAKGDMSLKEKAVKDLVDPIAQSLEKFNKEVGEIEKTRLEAYSQLTEQVKSLSVTEQSLQKRREI